MDDRVRELLERIRSGALAAADTAGDAARAAGRRAGQMADVAKLNVQLFDLNCDIDEVMQQLGRLMYDTHLGQLPPGESVPELLAKADELIARREELQDRIAALRQSRICPACGGTCGREDKFCKRCGAQL